MNRRLALVLLVATACGADAPSDRPNILVVTFDTLRADRLGCYGNEDWDATTSPVVDALAERGVLFEAATAPRGQTRPSLAAMLSGKYPITTGLRENPLCLLPEHRTLFEYLKDDEYQVGIFLANFWSKDDKPRHGWAFRGADADLGGMSPGESGRLESRYQSVWDQRVEDAAIGYLDEVDTSQPFAVWAHFYDIHKPYNPPAGYDLYGHSDEVSGPLASPGPDSGAMLEHFMQQFALEGTQPTAAVLRRLKGLYDGAITATDARLGRILEKLDEIGAADNTFIVFTSDHGESLNDRNGYFGHGNSIYYDVLRLPLIFTGPGLPAGARTPVPIQNIDITPTLLELVGLPVPDDMEGRSVVGLLRGESAEPPRPFSFWEWQDVMYAVGDGKRKYIHNPSHAHPQKSPFTNLAFGYAIDCFEGYDVTTDPVELNNLFEGLDPSSVGRQGLPEEFVPLRRALLEWLAEPHHEREMTFPCLDDDVVARLLDMGYVGGTRERNDALLLGDCDR